MDIFQAKRSQSDSNHSGNHFLLTFVIPFATMIASFGVYYLTAYRTIAWWGSPQYSLAACTLGIQHPPGSLIATLIGWVWVKLIWFANPAFALNLLAGLIASTIAVLLCRLAFSLIPNCETRERLFWAAGAALAAITFAFSETIWLYSVKFTPYIISPLFTVLILAVLLRWWRLADRVGAWYWILLLALLFGLDFSVHRTNSLLIPGAILWILIRRPSTYLQVKNWLAAVGGLLLGLATHLLIIPMAMAKPFLNAGNPDSLSRFWDYVTVKQAGGSFLVQFLPRKADFLSVQVADFIGALKNNFFSVGSQPPLIILPLVMVIIGIVALIKTRRRLGLALLMLFIVSSLTTVVYFNIPANFFRSLHRHYLPCLVILSLFLVYGAGSLLQWAQNRKSISRILAIGLAAALLIYMPVSQIIRNYHTADGSHSLFARDLSISTLNGLPTDAILLTSGDNDTFPLWYLQAAEGVRPDVTVLNLSLLNTSWYLSQVIERESDLPLQHILDNGKGPSFVLWSDSTIAVPVDHHVEGHGIPTDSLLDTVTFEISPNIADQYLMIQDQVVLHLIEENQFRRPLYVGYSTPRSSLAWLRPYLRMEGMASRFVPLQSPSPNLSILRQNLFERYIYSGYTDSSIALDPVSQQMASSLWSLFLTLAQTSLETGDSTTCREAVERLIEFLPAERLDLPERMLQMRETILERCDEA